MILVREPKGDKAMLDAIMEDSYASSPLVLAAMAIMLTVYVICG